MGVPTHLALGATEQGLLHRSNRHPRHLADVLQRSPVLVSGPDHPTRRSSALSPIPESVQDQLCHRRFHLSRRTRSRR